MSKFTPGPWEIQNQGPQEPVFIIGPEPRSQFIARAYGQSSSIDPKTQEANARLIATSPTLYDTLNRVHDIINSYAGISAIKEACYIIQDAPKKAGRN